ncbi:hypothetical protein [Sporolactobacillus terrae]|uniref:hypothetical protein n=1 Tax=Sporolactobacillus terrae TaxID=269673 RepID=UPI000490177C|nr:hypothetical protein [Sporolactobacillus terrae]
MSEETYVLKNWKSEKVLEKLNSISGYAGFKCAIEEIHQVNGKEDVIDMANACWSHKRIVNPMSPKEELRLLRDAYAGPVDITNLGAAKGEELIDSVVEIIAREHPDVKDWLKDGDHNA